MHTRSRILVAPFVLTTLAFCSPAPATGSSDQAPAVVSVSPPSHTRAGQYWAWPIDGVRAVANPYRAPAHAYGAGHRGIDIVATTDGAVRAPADGIVAFRGSVVDRPLLTIEHADGYVSTFEPLTSDLTPGDLVATGDTIGTVASGGHALPGTLHLGVRLEGSYINPMVLFGAVPRAVLLPCCAPL